MPEYEELEEIRDDELREKLVFGPEIIHRQIIDWCTDETKALLFGLSTFQATLKDGDPLKTAIDAVLADLDWINRKEIEGVKSRFRERRDEIKGKLYDGLWESHQHMIDSLAGAERILRRLEEIREKARGLIT
ncbi:MAG: hypothetical protein FJ315_03230 [SAR202 cluster bacterium]|nr:hypothetical protein [SAR202 cluster bacterium]